MHSPERVLSRRAKPGAENKESSLERDPSRSAAERGSIENSPCRGILRLKSIPRIDFFAPRTGCEWWSQAESNRRPLECHSSALPTELWPRMSIASIAGSPRRREARNLVARFGVIKPVYALLICPRRHRRLRRRCPRPGRRRHLHSARRRRHRRRDPLRLLKSRRNPHRPRSARRA